MKHCFCQGSLLGEGVKNCTMENLCNFILGKLYEPCEHRDKFVMLSFYLDDDQLTVQNVYSDNYQVGD